MGKMIERVSGEEEREKGTGDGRHGKRMESLLFQGGWEGLSIRKDKCSCWDSVEGLKSLNR